MKLTKENVAQTIDHTYLKPNGTLEDIKQVCKEALHNNFATVALAPDFVSFAHEKLGDSNVGICAAIGFPLGYNTSSTKRFEAQDAIENGASEVDMVINITRAKEGGWQAVKDDIQEVADVVGEHILKVILETCYLSDFEIKKLVNICKRVSGVNFVKTSTGFGPEGAKVKDVELMKKEAGGELEVKAAGGIRTLEGYKKMRRAGATRIGSSSGIEILSALE